MIITIYFSAGFLIRGLLFQLLKLESKGWPLEEETYLNIISL